MGDHFLGKDEKKRITKNLLGLFLRVAKSFLRRVFSVRMVR